MKIITFILISLLSLSFIEGKSLKVKGNKLYDGDGNEFIFRGINIAHAWFTTKTQFSINEVAALGANSARIVLACGSTYPKTLYAEVKQIIKWCRNAGLICVLEVHDFTGSDNPYDITGTTLNYWKEMKDLVNSNLDYVVVNIANEWQGTWNKGSLWGDTYVKAVKALRQYGIKNVIMIDASGYAQETGPVIRDAKRVLNADPDKNVVFSYHVYSALGKDDNTLLNGFNGLKNTGVCWIAGEFGFWQNGGDVVYKTLMNYCKVNGIGWIAWSWSGNSGIDTCLDLTSPNTFSRNDLTKWGKEIFYGNGGIQSTSKKAYSGSSSSIIYCSSCKVISTGDDGTKWGYENGKSCLIDTSRCQSSSDYCSSCEVTAKGDDGSLWGYENGKSCKIDTNKCKNNGKAPNGFPYCTSCQTTATSDDGTRWGYENGDSCVINPNLC